MNTGEDSIQKYSHHAWAITRRAVPLTVTVVALAAAAARLDFASLLSTLRELHLPTLLWVVVLLLAGNLLACLRLRLIALDFGQKLSIREAVVAATAGQLAGTFFFQIIGQTIARSAVLSKSGISMPTTIVITGYERIVAAAVSFLIALAGTAYLFGRIHFDFAGGGEDFLKIMAGIILVAAAGSVFAWGGVALRAVQSVLSTASALRLTRIFLISVVIQATTMAAYIAAAQSLPVSPDLKSLMAATALVMLAASIPISFAGWGMREISAIYALGMIGVPYATALLMALLIGAFSILVTALLAIGVSLIRTRGASARVIQFQRRSIDYLEFLAWLLPLVAVSAVFFQIYVPIGDGRINVNLADGVVLFGGALAIQQIFAARDVRSLFRQPHLGFYVAATSAVVLLSFIHGWIAFGLTNWALVNRLFGWLVILCYAGTGALLVIRRNGDGLRMLLLTFISAGLAIAALDLLQVFFIVLGVLPPSSMDGPRIEGFAQNPNAFAFQLLLVAIAVIAFRKPDNSTLLPFALAVMGLVFSGSRAGQGTFVLIMLLALYLRMVTWRWLGLALLLAVAGTFIVSGEVLQLIASPNLDLGHSLAMIFHYETSGAGTSNAQRFLSILWGLQMFAAHPVFGAGLGAFVVSFVKDEHGNPLIIHSTPIWLLAETGLVGCLVFVVPWVLIMKREWRNWFASGGRHDPAGILLLLSLTGFAVMAEVHELLYQRALWLILGAALASARLPAGRKTVSKAPPAP